MSRHLHIYASRGLARGRFGGDERERERAGASTKSSSKKENSHRRVDRLRRVLPGVTGLDGRRADVDDDGVDVVCVEEERGRELRF